MRYDFITETSFGKLAERLPAHLNWVKITKAVTKSVILGRRLIRGTRLIFQGLQSVSFEKFYSPGAGSDEALVNTCYSSVSPGTERGYYLDDPNFYQPRPYVPGYSGCGIVLAAGRNVRGFNRRNLVAGTFKHASKNIVDKTLLVPVPAVVKRREAAFAGLGVIALTGLRAAALTGGERVGVLGQGILGQMVNQMARAEGAAGVTALALGSSKQELAEKSGVDEFIALEGFDRPLSSLGYDVVIDSTGSMAGFEAALEMVRPGGRVVMLGSIAGYGRESDWARVVVDKAIEVRGAHVRNLAAAGLTYREEAARFLDLLAEGKLKLGHLVTDVYKPGEAQEIYRRLADGDRSMVGVLIDWR